MRYIILFLLVVAAFIFANIERGYFAFGGELVIAFAVVLYIVGSTIYRKSIR